MTARVSPMGRRVHRRHARGRSAVRIGADHRRAARARALRGPPAHQGGRGRAGRLPGARRSLFLRRARRAPYGYSIDICQAIVESVAQAVGVAGCCASSIRARDPCRPHRPGWPTAASTSSAAPPRNTARAPRACRFLAPDVHCRHQAPREARRRRAARRATWRDAGSSSPAAQPTRR